MTGSEISGPYSMMLPMLQWIKPLVLFFAYGVEKQENKKVTIGDIYVTK
jgi:hypothetical protein